MGWVGLGWVGLGWVGDYRVGYSNKVGFKINQIFIRLEIIL